MSVDIRCCNLASNFLENDPELAHIATTDRVDRLAKWIQDAAESWIEAELENYEPSEADLTRNVGGQSGDAELRHTMAEARKLK